MFRPAWLEINLDNLSDNFKKIKKIVSPSVKVLVCVKKDAYGHGMIPVAKRLVKEGVDYLGVADIDEAIKLRKEKINKPILVMGAVLPKDVEPFFKYDLVASISNWDLAYALEKKAKYFNKKIKVHIKVDTGMGRLGVLYTEAYNFIKRLTQLKFLELEGVFSHFPLAETDPKFTLKQIERLKELKQKLFNSKINIPLYHCANSAGTLLYKESHLDMVRPGLVIYGMYPKDIPNIKFKPVMSLKARIVLVKRLPKNFGISYGHTYYTKKDTNIAVIPVGYGDGYFRKFSNKAFVLIRGRRFRIAGRICMDQFMVDVGNLNLKIGEEVVLLGRQKKEIILAEELASLSKTIPYEITTSLGMHLPRIYLSKI